MKGKNVVEIKMKITTPEPDIFIYEGIEVISKDKNMFDSERNIKKRQLRDKADHSVYRSLHKITKLPESLRPEKNGTICGFRDISEEKNEGGELTPTGTVKE